MMTVLPLAQIGILLNRPHYIQEAKYQFLLHVQYLSDPVTGLWYHGWEFTPTPGSSTAGIPDDTKPGHNFADALWARGNCWITVAIPVFLEVLGEKYLPSDDPIRKFLISTFRRQVDALVKCQNKQSGLWHTLLVDPSSYVETSATAGFAAGIFAGIRMVCCFSLLLLAHGLTLPGPDSLIIHHDRYCRSSRCPRQHRARWRSFPSVFRYRYGPRPGILRQNSNHLDAVRTGTCYVGYC